MPERRYKIKTIVLLIVLSIVLGSLSAVGYAGYRYVCSGENKGKHSIDLQNIVADKNICIEDDTYTIAKNECDLVINIPDQYINKLSFQYDSEYFSNCTIYVTKENIYGDKETQVIRDIFMKSMSRSVINIGGKVSKIVFEFADSENTIKISNFLIDNSIKINPLVIIFVSSVLFVIGFLLLFKKENAESPEKATFVCVLVISTCLILLQPPYCTGWDEQIHYMNSYKLGVLSKGEPATLADDYLIGNAYEINTFTEAIQESVEERIDFIKVMDSFTDTHGVVADDYNIQISSFGYVLQALALKVGIFLNLPFYLVWLMGKFTNVLLYAIIMCLSIRIIPIGKRLLSIITMMPTMIFLSTVYTYDITVIAFITLGICILIREVINKDQVFEYRWRVAFLMSVIFGCLPKAVYAPLILGVLFLGPDKFYSVKDRYRFKGIVILSFLALMSTFVLPTLISPPAVADTRGGDTSTARQIQYVLGKPLGYAVVLIKSVWNNLHRFIIGEESLANFAYLGRGTMPAFCAALLVGTTITDTYTVDNRKVSMSKKFRVLSAVLILVVVALIWTALYLSFTAVGLTSINGVQARYYFPFLFLVYLLLQPGKIENKISVDKYQTCIMIISVWLVFQQIYSLVFLPRCL